MEDIEEKGEEKRGLPHSASFMSTTVIPDLKETHERLLHDVSSFARLRVKKWKSGINQKSFIISSCSKFK